MSFIMEIFVCGLVGFILSLNLFFFLVEKVRNKKVSLRPAENIIVITGCDSGFGEMTSRALAKLGFKVVSACLTDDGIQRLKNVVSIGCVLVCLCVVDKEHYWVAFYDFCVLQVCCVFYCAVM
jgi:hypothetical protein